MTPKRLQFSIEGTFHFELDAAESVEATIDEAKRLLAQLDGGTDFRRLWLPRVTSPYFSPSGMDTDYADTLEISDGDTGSPVEG